MTMKRYGMAEIKNVVEHRLDTVKRCATCNTEYDAGYFGDCPVCKDKKNARRLCSR